MSDVKTSKEKSTEEKKPVRPKRNFFKGRNFIYAKKECFFTKNRISYIDFKDVELLKRFVKKSGQIIPSRITGTTNINQKKLSKAVKRARYMGLLPFRGDIIGPPKKPVNSPRRLERSEERNKRVDAEGQEKESVKDEPTKKSETGGQE